MRIKSCLLFVVALGLAASLLMPAAQAGGLVVGIAVPVAVAEIPVAPVTVVTDYDPAVIVDGYCCSPGWHDGWHRYGWRDGYRGYARTAYEHPGYERRGYARPVNASVARGRAAARSGRR